MSRHAALRSEVVAALHQSDSEHLLPKPVDRDASGERVFRGNDPAREVESVPVLAGLLQWWQDRRSVRYDFLARGVVLAPGHDKGVARLRQVAEDEGRWGSAIQGFALFVDLGELGVERSERLLCSIVDLC